MIKLFISEFSCGKDYIHTLYDVVKKLLTIIGESIIALFAVCIHLFCV